MSFGIYSPTNLTEELEIPNVQYENTSYKLKITPTGIIDFKEDKEGTNFLGKFFKTLMAKLKLQ